MVSALTLGLAGCLERRRLGPPKVESEGCTGEKREEGLDDRRRGEVFSSVQFSSALKLVEEVD